MNPTLDILRLILYFIYCVLESCFRFIFPRRKKVVGEVVLVTGAGSGLGQALCVEFAKLGSIVVGWDISVNGLDATKKLIKTEVPRAIFKGYVRKDIGDVNILINNAGIVSGKYFLDTRDEDMEKTMRINTMAHFWTLKAFLPDMMDSNHGHIVSISSGAGMFGLPGQIDYATSKFGVVGMSEALNHELVHLNKTGVKVTVVCPSYIDTGMFQGVGNVKMISMIKLNDAVKKIVEAILTNQFLLLMPKLGYFLSVVKAIVPEKFLLRFAEVIGITQAMDTFVGRKNNNNNN